MEEEDYLRSESVKRWLAQHWFHVAVVALLALISLQLGVAKWLRELQWDLLGFMSRNEIENVAALTCLVGLLTAFSAFQTLRHRAVSPLAAALGTFLLPAFVALVWRISLGAGWSTIVVVPFVGFVAGAINGAYLRRRGIDAVFSLQPILCGISIACAGLAWFMRAP